MSAGLMKDVAFSDYFIFLSFKRTILSLLMSWPLNCWQLCYLTAHRTKASGVKLRIFYQLLRKTATSLLWGNTFSVSFLLWLVIVKYYSWDFPQKDVTGCSCFHAHALESLGGPFVVMCDHVCSVFCMEQRTRWILNKGLHSESLRKLDFTPDISCDIVSHVINLDITLVIC